MHRYRTHTCGALRDSDVGSGVRLSGWCHRIRDHGGVKFIDLRDHYGLTQVVIDPIRPPSGRPRRCARNGSCASTGPCGGARPEPKTLICQRVRSRSTRPTMEVLGPAAELPLPVFGEQEYPEETRLTYRFLDLRRDKLHRNIMTRSAVINSIRARMKDGGFFEFQTPILTASSPEGARDFSFPRASTPAASTPCRRRRSSTSS